MKKIICFLAALFAATALFSTSKEQDIIIVPLHTESPDNGPRGDLESPFYCVVNKTTNELSLSSETICDFCDVSFNNESTGSTSQQVVYISANPAYVNLLDSGGSYVIRVTLSSGLCYYGFFIL